MVCPISRENYYYYMNILHNKIDPLCNVDHLVFLFEGSGQPVNGAIPSLPSPTMPTFNMAAQTPNGQPGGTEAAVYTNGIPQTYPGRECIIHFRCCCCCFNFSLLFLNVFGFFVHLLYTFYGQPIQFFVVEFFAFQIHFFFLIRWCKLFTLIIRLLVNNTDALHLSIPAQGLPNGDAALQHAAYPGMQPYPGVGKS